MGQATRQPKYDQFWKWVEPTIGAYSDAVQMLLHKLTDEQLDELLVEITEVREATCENCGAACEYNTEICLCGKCEQAICENCGDSVGDWLEVGVIGVDAGLCWVGDPCYCVTKDATERPAETWSEFCDKLQDGREVDGAYPFNFQLGHAGLGIAVSTGYGDGVYPVSVRKNAEGRVMAVMVNFGAAKEVV